MHTSSRLSSRLFVALAAALLAGCAGINPASMTPEFTAVRRVAASRSVRVLPIQDTPSRNRAPAAIKGKMFREILVDSLRRSHLLRDVVTDGDSDLVLRVVLIQQTAVFPPDLKAFETRRELIAEYVLMDSATGEVVWSDHIRSAASIRAMGGNARITKSSEGAVRENILALLKAADEQWPAEKK